MKNLVLIISLCFKNQEQYIIKHKSKIKKCFKKISLWSRISKSSTNDICLCKIETRTTIFLYLQTTWNWNHTKNKSSLQDRSLKTFLSPTIFIHFKKWRERSSLLSYSPSAKLFRSIGDQLRRIPRDMPFHLIFNSAMKRSL